jgi:hypothetical protein
LSIAHYAAWIAGGEPSMPTTTAEGASLSFIMNSSRLLTSSTLLTASALAMESYFPVLSLMVTGGVVFARLV